MHMIKNYLSLIKFSHTIFALPFALIGFFIAYKNISFVDSPQKTYGNSGLKTTVDQGNLHVM